MTKDELITEANIIKDETGAGANTANRIGQMFTDIINNVQVTNSAAVPYYEVDLSSGAYSVTTNGIYEILNASGSAITFPNPSNYVGQTVILMNSDPSNDASIDGERPYTVQNDEISSIDNSVATFVSTGNKWILISTH